MDGDGPAPTFPVSATSAPSPASVAVDHGPTASAGNYRYEAAGYVASLTLDPRASSDLAGPPHLDEDYLILSTVHSAKGLEWDTVHVINVIDGAFPSDMALTSSVGLLEERRLFYVAATRARDELSIYTPLRLPHHRRARDDKHSYAPHSRFLGRAALNTMDIQENHPGAPASRPATTPAARVEMPALDDLWA
jgi:DNA helicase-2/ATP-dependent DNA helicase PcrA